MTKLKKKVALAEQIVPIMNNMLNMSPEYVFLLHAVFPMQLASVAAGRGQYAE